MLCFIKCTAIFLFNFVYKFYFLLSMKWNKIWDNIFIIFYSVLNRFIDSIFQKLFSVNISIILFCNVYIFLGEFCWAKQTFSFCTKTNRKINKNKKKNRIYRTIAELFANGKSFLDASNFIEQNVIPFLVVVYYW